MPDSTLVLNAPAIQRALIRIAHEIAERNEAGSEVVLVGISLKMTSGPIANANCDPTAIAASLRCDAAN